MKEVKKELRKKILAIRRALSDEEAEARSRTVLKNLVQSGLLEGRKVVALFASSDREVNTRPLFERLSSQGVKVVFPRVRDRGPHLDFYPAARWEDMEPSGFLGIPEPRPQGRPIPPEAFDLVIVPGVAFDSRGGRLGYGMGCYDRILARLREDALSLGLGYDFQLVPEVPMEPHDVFLDGIVVEQGVILPNGAVDHKTGKGKAK